MGWKIQRNAAEHGAIRMSKQTKLTKSARDQECQIRIPRTCNGDTTTTVLAHLPGGGMGGKVPDLFAAYSCSACHDMVDGRTKRGWNSPNELKVWHLEGVIRTQQIMLREGLLKVWQ